MPITEDHSKRDQMLLVKTCKYLGFCVHRRSYLLCTPVIEVSRFGVEDSGPGGVSEEGAKRKQGAICLCVGVGALTDRTSPKSQPPTVFSFVTAY